MFYCIVHFILLGGRLFCRHPPDFFADRGLGIFADTPRVHAGIDPPLAAGGRGYHLHVQVPGIPQLPDEPCHRVRRPAEQRREVLVFRPAEPFTVAQGRDLPVQQLGVRRDPVIIAHCGRDHCPVAGRLCFFCHKIVLTSCERQNLWYTDDVLTRSTPRTCHGTLPTSLRRRSFFAPAAVHPVDHRRGAGSSTKVLHRHRPDHHALTSPQQAFAHRANSSSLGMRVTRASAAISLPEQLGRSLMRA